MKKFLISFVVWLFVLVLAHFVYSFVIWDFTLMTPDLWTKDARIIFCLLTFHYFMFIFMLTVSDKLVGGTKIDIPKNFKQ